MLCPTECIGRNGAETKVTSVNVHMHDRGNSDARAAVLRHLRNGVELAPILVIDDFREGTADEVASTIAFLASADAGYLTGVAVDINGGLVFSG